MDLLKKSRLVFYGIVLLLISCNSSKKAVEENATEVLSDSKNYVMTILLELFNREKDSIKVYDIITKEGYLKNANSNDVNKTHKYLSVIEFSDNTPKIKRSFPDPLNKVVEFVDANGNLGKKDVSLDSDVVPLRVNYNKAISKLKIYKRKDSDWSLISTFPLNQ